MYERVFSQNIRRLPYLHIVLYQISAFSEILLWTIINCKVRKSIRNGHKSGLSSDSQTVLAPHRGSNRWIIINRTACVCNLDPWNKLIDTLMTAFTWHSCHHPGHIHLAAVGDSVVLSLSCKFHAQIHRLCTVWTSQTWRGRSSLHQVTVSFARVRRVCTVFLWSYFVLGMCYSFLQTAEVGHNDESSAASDWLISLRQAPKAICDWLGVVLASFLVLAAPQASLTEWLYTEGAMLMSGFL